MKVVLEIFNLSKRFAQIVALKNISFKVYQGEIVGVIGANGSGKTTLLKVVVGLLKPTKGSVKVFGKSLEDLSEADLYMISYLPENPNMPSYLTGKDFIDVMASLLRIKTEDVMRLGYMFGLDPYIDRPIYTYSKGTRKKLALATVLAKKSRLIVLDEPFEGLDASSIKSLKRILEEKSAKGNAVLLATHIVKDTLDLYDRVIILDRGKISRICRRDEISVELNDLMVYIHES